MILPNGGISELTYSEYVARRVISMDETGHSFTTEVDKGGSRAISFGCNNDGRKSRRGIRGSRYTTGVYDVNTGGENLPPLYILIDQLNIVVITKFKVDGIKVYLRCDIYLQSNVFIQYIANIIYTLF